MGIYTANDHLVEYATGVSVEVELYSWSKGLLGSKSFPVGEVPTASANGSINVQSAQDLYDDIAGTKVLPEEVVLVIRGTGTVVSTVQGSGCIGPSSVPPALG